MSRPFVAWDGEGTTDVGEHRYVLLASSLGHTLTALEGLNTFDIFECLLNASEQNPDAIHVIYGAGYDFNNWLRTLDRDDVVALYRGDILDIGPYRIEWLVGRSFYIMSFGRSVRVYDVLPFFQNTFVNACDEYLKDDFTHRDEIVADKQRRSSFTADDLPRVIRYNQYELENLVKLMNVLRNHLANVDMLPQRWYGPGAVASSLMTRKGIKDAICPLPTDVARASRYAYAGGRFERFAMGSVDGPSYEYDINSAYPAALRNVPNLNRGRWEYVDPNSDDWGTGFGVYRVRYTMSKSVPDWPLLPGPLVCRTNAGAIFYPHNVAGWYWTPEIESLLQYASTLGGTVTRFEGWRFRESDDDRPFAFIDELYRKRQALKKAGDGAHYGIKLGLNSLYGKLAQQIGWKDTENGPKIPPFHNLAWAGYTTSHCRATILRAVLQNPHSVIATATDALFTTEPLSLPVGPNLGEWEETKFTHLTYCQAGVYFAITDSGKEINRTRGFNRGTITRAEAQKSLASGQPLVGKSTRFHQAGIANAQDWSQWCHFVTTERVMNMFGGDGSKRFLFSEYDDRWNGTKPNIWHRLYERNFWRDEPMIASQVHIEWEPESEYTTDSNGARAVVDRTADYETEADPS